MAELGLAPFPRGFDIGRMTALTTRIHALSALSACLVLATGLSAQRPASHLQHSRARPRPAVVTPASGVFTAPPPDAAVLFGGTSLSRWMQADSTAPRWKVAAGAFEVTPGTGSLVTRESFGDVQLHIEWMSPNPPRGKDQDRGNSGVFFGGGRYEVQVLDSYDNPTYADGQAASVYGQYPPLVNASRPPGTWQSYDIVYRRPRFDANGALRTAARITVLHNGILVQDNVELIGPTANGSRPPFEQHADRLPISLQDHEHPVRFRNVWVRDLEAGSVQYRSPSGETYRASLDTGPVYRAAEALAADQRNVARFIALGVAQSGARQFREAIETFTRGLEVAPNDAMLYRWRGHRYLSVREYDKAAADFARGLAIDSTNYGILFHLGVLRFVRGDFSGAAAAFAKAQPRAPDGGELTGSTDWLWMSLARAGRLAEANAMLARRPDTLAAPPGYAYAQRLKLYRGELTPETLFSPADTADVQVATLSFGLGNWYLVRGDTARARASFERAVRSGGWPGFGFIASEAELSRMTARTTRK